MIPARAPLYRAHKIVFVTNLSDATSRDITQAVIVIELLGDTFRVVKNTFDFSDNSEKPISELTEFVSKAYAEIKHHTIITEAVVNK